MGIYRIPVRLEDSGLGGGPWMNIWHCRLVDDTETGDLDSALDALQAFYENVRGHIPNTTNITIGEGMIKDPLGSPTYVNDDRRVLAGGGAAAQHLPALLAVVVSWRTSSATRSGRGRTFVGPFVDSAKQGDGTPSAAVLTAINGAAGTLVQESSGLNGWAFGVLSTKQGVLRDFVGHSVKDRFAYLSSRRD